MSDQLILQFSTCSPHWRGFTPNFIKNKQGLFAPLNLVFDKYWASPIIRRLSHSPFTHVDMMLEDGNLLGASNNADAPIIRGNPAGVAVRPQNYQPFGYRRRMILKTHRAADITAIALTQVGKEFDNTGLKDFIGDSFPGLRDWRLRDSWYCSELMGWALEAGGFWQPRQLIWPKNRLTPTDLILCLLTDDRFVNQETFWNQIPGLTLDPGEK